VVDTEYPEFFESKIIVRKFYEFDPHLEFRAFVNNGQLTALSQYESGIFFPNLQLIKEVTCKTILSFFDIIKQDIDLESYVIDFMILRDGTTKVVELNPWNAHSSGCMFSWKHDRELILNGPFTFRVLEQALPKDKALTSLPPFWVSFVHNFYNAKRSKNFFYFYEK